MSTYNPRSNVSNININSNVPMTENIIVMKTLNITIMKMMLDNIKETKTKHNNDSTMGTNINMRSTEHLSIIVLMWYL